MQGWVSLSSGLKLNIHCWGIVLDPSNSMVAGIFGGWKSALLTFSDLLPKNKFKISSGKNIPSFSTFQKNEYRVYTLPLPGGQGSGVVYIHRSALAEYAPVQVGELVLFYAWGESKDANTPFLPLWSSRMQDLHEFPIDDAWQDPLWNVTEAKGWAQKCSLSLGFAPVWEIAVDPKEVEAVFMAELTNLK